MLYHGSTIPGLQYIEANSKSHTSGANVAYFTSDRCYALVSCRDRNNNFITMGKKSDGKQHYFERFPNQLKTIYGGKKGYLYIINSSEGFKNTTGNTWESTTSVPVDKCEYIADVYKEILQEEAFGRVVIHRYSEIDIVEQKMHANYIKNHLDDQGMDMKEFNVTYFSSLWD